MFTFSTIISILLYIFLYFSHFNFLYRNKCIKICIYALIMNKRIYAYHIVLLIVVYYYGVFVVVVFMHFSWDFCYILCGCDWMMWVFWEIGNHLDFYLSVLCKLSDQWKFIQIARTDTILIWRILKMSASL